MAVRLKRLCLRLIGILGRATLFVMIGCSVVWIPLTNIVIDIACIDRGNCNSAFVNFLWIWAVPVIACTIAFSLWVLGARAAEAADRIND